MSKLPIILTITSCEIKRTMSKLPIIHSVKSREQCPNYQYIENITSIAGIIQQIFLGCK